MKVDLSVALYVALWS